MKLKRFSGIFFASAIAIAGLGLMTTEANAKGKPGGGGSGGGGAVVGGGGGGGGFIEGTCNVADVFAGGTSATSCANFSGNDSQVGFLDYLNGSKEFTNLGGYDAVDSGFASQIAALDGDWSLFGKSDGGNDKVNDIGGELQSGNWSLTESLTDPFVVVLKSGNFYSSYLFQDYEDAIQSGTFNVKGVTADPSKPGKYAALSHLSVYSFVPRIQEVSPPDIPEPTAALGLLLFAGLGYRMKRATAQP